MICGIGIDLVENDRIRKVIDRWGDKFLTRVFSAAEIDYCNRHIQAHIHYAARFAVKESFLKALGIGMGRGVKMKEIEVLNEESGKPELRLKDGAKKAYELNGILNAQISITHTTNYASAIVLLEK